MLVKRSELAGQGEIGQLFNFPPLQYGIRFPLSNTSALIIQTADIWFMSPDPKIIQFKHSHWLNMLNKTVYPEELSMCEVKRSEG